MRTALYIRVSTDKQEVSNQRLQLLDYCKKKGYDVIKEYVDVISGKEIKRPQFDLMFYEARNHRQFELVLFWDLSRFSRAGTLFTLQKLTELNNLGVKWESYREPFFSSVGEWSDVVLSILSTVAKIERTMLSERTKAGLVNAKNVGKRGKDDKPRKRRSDRGLKRGMQKTNIDYLREIRAKKQDKEVRF